MSEIPAEGSIESSEETQVPERAPHDEPHPTVSDLDPDENIPLGMLSQLLHAETTLTRLGASGQLAAIHELVGLFIKIIPEANPNKLVSLFEMREKFCSTAAIDGVAFPFAELEGVAQPVLALACSRDGVDFGSPRGESTELFVALVIPADRPHLTVQLLARLTRLFQSSPQLKDQLIQLESAAELRAHFINAEALL